MGVLTVAYSIPSEMMKKIRATNSNLDLVLGLGANKNSDWKVESYSFEEHLEETVEILRETGYTKTAEKLDCEKYFYAKGENYLKYKDHDVWIVLPDEVKIISAEIQKATFKKLKAVGLENELTDYDGEVIEEDMYDQYVGDIDKVKKFFKKSAAQKNYLLFAAG
jgi:hypothetical protein